MRSRLPLWQAALFVLFGGLAANLAGVLTSSLVRAWLVTRGPGARSPDAQSIVLVPAMLSSAAALIAVACFAPIAAGVPLRAGLGLKRAPPLCFVAACIGTVMLGPTADCLMRGMQLVFPSLSLGVVPLLHGVVRRIDWPIALCVFALLPGISEELLFRGLLQTAAAPRRSAIAISALSFAAFHLDPHHIAGVLPIGFFLAWVASRCGTLVTIGAHVANNAAAVAAVHSPALDVGYGTDSPMPWSWLPVSLALVAICSFAIARSTAGMARISYSDAANL